MSDKVEITTQIGSFISKQAEGRFRIGWLTSNELEVQKDCVCTAKDIVEAQTLRAQVLEEFGDINMSVMLTPNDEGVCLKVNVA